MSTTAVRRSSLPGITWAGLGVLAGAFIFVVVGGSPASAADDESPSPRGLLGVITTTTSSVIDVVSPVVETPAPVVGEAADTVQAVVTPVVDRVAKSADEIVDKVEDAAASVPLVGPAAGAAAHTAGGASELLSGVTGAVTEVLSSTPVAAVTAPVLELVGSVPVIGAIVTDSGAAGLVETVVAIVDDTASDAGSILDVVVPPPVTGAIDPREPLPNHPQTPGDDTGQTDEGADDAAGGPSEEHAPHPTAGDDGAAEAIPASVPLGHANVPARPLPAGAPGNTGAALTDPDAMGVVGSSPPSHAPPAVGSSSFTAGGASVHDLARLNSPPGAARGASERAPTATGDDVPASPVFETDVAPD